MGVWVGKEQTLSSTGGTKLERNNAQCIEWCKSSHLSLMHMNTSGLCNSFDYNTIERSAVLPSSSSALWCPKIS